MYVYWIHIYVLLSHLYSILNNILVSSERRRQSWSILKNWERFALVIWFWFFFLRDVHKFQFWHISKKLQATTCWWSGGEGTDFPKRRSNIEEQEGKRRKRMWMKEKRERKKWKSFPLRNEKVTIMNSIFPSFIDVGVPSARIVSQWNKNEEDIDCTSGIWCYFIREKIEGKNPSIIST